MKTVSLGLTLIHAMEKKGWTRQTEEWVTAVFGWMVVKLDLKRW